MQEKNESYRHERLGLQFLSSLRSGEPAELAGLWHQAETDPALEALFEELIECESAVEVDLSQTDQQTKSGQLVLKRPESSPAPRDCRPLPPLAPVIVHQPHDIRKISESPRTHRYEEPRSNAGFIEKA